jgi:hypothetical protein
MSVETMAVCGSQSFAELRIVRNDATLVKVVDDGIDSALRSLEEAMNYRTADEQNDLGNG